MDRGGLTKQQAELSPWSHVLWNTVSGDDQICRPELHHVPLRGEDKLLLCTDGLTRHVDDERIAMLLGFGAQDACRALVNDANDAGGRDNVTVIMATEKSSRSSLGSTVKMASS